MENSNYSLMMKKNNYSLNIIIGVVFPVLFIHHDLVLFNDSFFGLEPILKNYIFLGYFLIYMEIFIFIYSFYFSYMKKKSIILAGVLAAGSFFYLFLGIITCIISIITFFPFIPQIFLIFFISFIYFIYFLYHTDAGKISKIKKYFLFLIFFSTISFPLSIQEFINRTLEIIIKNQFISSNNLLILKICQNYIYMDQLVFAYFKETDFFKKIKIAKIYKEITKIDIDNRLGLLKLRGKW